MHLGGKKVFKDEKIQMRMYLNLKYLKVQWSNPRALITYWRKLSFTAGWLHPIHSFLCIVCLFSMLTSTKVFFLDLLCVCECECVAETAKERLRASEAPGCFDAQTFVLMQLFNISTMLKLQPVLIHPLIQWLQVWVWLDLHTFTSLNIVMYCMCLYAVVLILV